MKGLNTAAYNRLAVQQAQTKLATDTARAIEDLRVQGEFDKADAMLEITQEYLAQLMSLEQWAAEYNFSVEQFNASLKQWEAEYNLELEQMGIAQEQWNEEMELKKDQFDYDRYLNSVSLEQSEKSLLAEVGWTMLEMGLMPDKEYLNAMEVDQATAEQMMAVLGSGEAEVGDFTDPGVIYGMLYEAGLTDENRAAVKAYLMNLGMDGDLAGAFANAYVDSEYGRLEWTGYGEWGDGWSEEEWNKIMEAAETNLKEKRYNAFSDANMEWITSKISQEQWEELEKLLQSYGFNPYRLFDD